MTQHTPEPWIVDDYIDWNICANGKTLASASLLNFCKDEYTANARRIVACVNKCAGFTTAKLEGDDLVLVPRDEFRGTLQQRDELLKAAKSARRALAHANENCHGLYSDAYDEISEAITKARGQQ